MTQLIKVAENTELIIVSKGSSRVEIEPNARLIHYRLPCEDKTELDVFVQKGASYHAITGYFGHNKDVVKIDLVGQGAMCQSDAIYRACDKNKLEIESTITHKASNTVSKQLIKGIALDEGKAHFKGCIFIEPNLKQIDGSQQHRGLLMSSKAHIKAVPKLEIYSDDVKCSHGSAIGSVDKMQLFYLRSRGLSKKEAKLLLVNAFLNEVLDKINSEEIRADFEKRFL